MTRIRTMITSALIAEGAAVNAAIAVLCEIA
jgi:hypothetical protein